MSTYADENKLGRQRAAQIVEDCAATGDLPRLVREIRKMAGANDGVGVGFKSAFQRSDRIMYRSRGSACLKAMW